MTEAPPIRQILPIPVSLYAEWDMFVERYYRYCKDKAIPAEIENTAVKHRIMLIYYTI